MTPVLKYCFGLPEVGFAAGDELITEGRKRAAAALGCDAADISYYDGAFHRVLSLPDDVDPGRLKEIAIEHGVDFAHGSDFHIRNDAGPYIRLAFGFPTVDEIMDGVSRLGESLRVARGTAV